MAIRLVKFNKKGPDHASGPSPGETTNASLELTFADDKVVGDAKYARDPVGENIEKVAVGFTRHIALERDVAILDDHMHVRVRITKILCRSTTRKLDQRGTPDAIIHGRRRQLLNVVDNICYTRNIFDSGCGLTLCSERI